MRHDSWAPLLARNLATLCLGREPKVRVATKLVCENKTYWYEHLPTILFFYRITYKVATKYTPYKLVCWLQPLMPT